MSAVENLQSCII